MWANTTFVGVDNYSAPITRRVDSFASAERRKNEAKPFYDRYNERHLEPIDRVCYVKSLSLNGESKSLRQIIKLVVEPGEDGMVVVFSPALSIGGSGSSLRDALTALSDNAFAVWSELRATPKEELHTSGQAALDRLNLVFSE